MSFTMISDIQIKKFQDLHRVFFGEEISAKEALEKGLRLVRLIRLINEQKEEDGEKDAHKHKAI